MLWTRARGSCSLSYTPGGSGVDRWSPEVGGLEFQLLGCWLAAMWLRPALGKVLTPWEPASWRAAARAAGATALLVACGSSRPVKKISPTRAAREVTATPLHRMVRRRRSFSWSRRAAAPLASLPLSGWRPRPPPRPSWGRALEAPPEPRPGWLLPVAPGFGLGLRVSAIRCTPGAGGDEVHGDSMETWPRPCPLPSGPARVGPLGGVPQRAGNEEAMRMGVLRTKSV